jgi:hypothetical protein
LRAKGSKRIANPGLAELRHHLKRVEQQRIEKVVKIIVGKTLGPPTRLAEMQWFLVIQLLASPETPATYPMLIEPLTCAAALAQSGKYPGFLGNVQGFR